MRYQAGDSEGALFMLAAFSDFLEGFVMLLRGQSVKRMTYSHRIFLSNFVKNSGLARSLKGKAPIGQAFLAAEAAITSVSIQLRPIDEDDLRQEVIEIFLGTLRRYRSRNNENFLVPYILKSFPYALTRRVQQLIKDPLVNLASDKILSLETLGSIHERNADYNPFMNRPSVRDVVKHLTTSMEENVQDVEEDELGNSWLRGDSCDERLSILTRSERKILKRFYHLQMTDNQISKELGVSYNTAIRRRHHIEAKLKGKYIPPECRWCHKEIPKAPLGRQPRQCLDCREVRRAERQRRRKSQKKPLTGGL